MIVGAVYDRPDFADSRKNGRSSLEAARYRACAPRPEAARYRACAPRSAPIGYLA
jgi:hypothetical protein